MSVDTSVLLKHGLCMNTQSFFFLSLVRNCGKIKLPFRDQAIVVKTDFFFLKAFLFYFVVCEA